MINTFIDSAMCDLNGRFGTRFEIRLTIDGVGLEVAAIRTKVAITIFQPRHSRNGRAVRRDAGLYVKAIDETRVAIDAFLASPQGQGC